MKRWWIMPKVQTIRRISKLEAAAAPPKPPPRVFVVIGADEPRQPGEITIGGVPTDERPGPDDVLHVIRIVRGDGG